MIFYEGAGESGFTARIGVEYALIKSRSPSFQMDCGVA